NPYLQTILALILLTANICVHYFAAPYVDPWLDIMDSTSLLSLYFTAISGMVYLEQDENGIDAQMWTVIFFIAIGIQMMLGISIFMMDIRNQRQRSGAIEDLDRSFMEERNMYAKRHCMMAAAMAELQSEHSSSSAGTVSMETVISTLQRFEDASPPAFNLWFGTLLYKHACLLAQHQPASRQKCSDIFSEVPMSRHTVQVPPVIDIQLVQYSLALDYLESLMRSRVRETAAMFTHLDGDKNQKLTIEELLPIWEDREQNTIDTEGNRLLLDCLFTELCDEKTELRIEHLQDGMIRLLSGELQLVEMMIHVLPERAQAWSDLMTTTTNQLIKAGAKDKLDPSGKPILKRTHTLSAMIHTLTFTNKEIAARCEVWTALSKVLDPAAMKLHVNLAFGIKDGCSSAS
ncbi:hypothetical protein CYMTET_8208, partial [Cymbomonas tetramitiformis]